MSPFRNIRIFPQHGETAARITWEMEPGYLPGEVFAAFSLTGIKGSWTPAEGDAVPSALGQLDDLSLKIDGGHHIGYYRLMLRNVTGDFLSPAIAIMGDVTAREYGLARGIIRREFLEMRAINGYPVWHCIPRDFGIPAANIDPDTGTASGIACSGVDYNGSFLAYSEQQLAYGESSYGLPFEGGYFPPVLTWMRPMTIDRGTIKDAQDETTPEVTDETAARLLAFPRPQRQHMLVDPVTDRRYVVMDEIKPFLLRGTIPLAYEVKLDFIAQGDPRYKFQVPTVDMREYRRIKRWW